MKLRKEQSDALNKYILEHYINTSAGQIGKDFGISDSAVRARAYRLGLISKMELKQEPRSKRRIIVEGNKTIHTCLG